MNEIITDLNTPKPKANFAKKEQVEIPRSLLSEVSVQIPHLYYWEEVIDGKSVLMTMAFKYKDMSYGMSYPIEDENKVMIDINRKKLFAVVKESLDSLVHHGDKVLDPSGNIDPRLVNEQEALRWKFDPQWKHRVAAFNKLVKIAPITKKKAVKLGFLPQPKTN